MNVAVAPERRRGGVARGLIGSWSRRGGGSLPFTLEVRVSNRPAIAMYERLRLPLRRSPPSLLPGQRRGRADHVARLSDAGAMRILALETSCDDTCAAVLDGARILSNVISSQAAAHAQLRRRRARGRLASPPRAGRAGGRGGAGRGGRLPRRDRGGRGDGRARADRRPPGRRQHRQGDRRAAAAAADPGRPPAGSRRRQLPRARTAGAALPLPGRERRPHAARRRCATTSGHELLGQTLDDAAGEAFDKVGAPARPRLSRAARLWKSWRAKAIPRRSRCRWR